MNITTIGTNDYGQKCYQIYLATSTTWYQVFQVYAYNASEAIDMVADYVEENEFEGLYTDFYSIADECEPGQSVDEYAEAHYLTCCGNHGIYVPIVGLEEIK